MRDLGPSTFHSPAGATPPAGDKLGAAGAMPPGGLEPRSAYSSWRYASARESSDSEGYRGSPMGHANGPGVSPSSAAAAVSWQAASSAIAARAAAAAPNGNDSPAEVPRQGSPDVDSPGGAAAHVALPAAAAATGVAAGTAALHDRQLWSPSKRPHATADGSHGHGGMALGAAAPVGSGLAVPAGMDAGSYAAGERAAFMRAFQQALPGQQALGQLFSAVDALHSRLEEEAAHWRAVQGGASRTTAQLEAALERLDGVEARQLPELQRKWEELASRGPPEQLVEALGGLQQAVALLAAQREQLVAERARQAGPGYPFPTRQLHWLLLVGAGYGQALLSKADVAALFLSRKILLTPAAADEPPRLGRQLSAALGAALFVAAVEAAYQAQHRALRRLPTIAQRATAPAQLGMRVARAAVWSAALVLAAARTRDGCQAASDSVCGSAAALLARVQLPAWMTMLPGAQWWQARRVTAAAADEETATDDSCAGECPEQ